MNATLVSSVIGAVISGLFFYPLGYRLGRMSVDVHRIAENLGDHHMASTPVETKTKPRIRFDFPSVAMILGGLALILAGLSFMQYRSQQGCLNDYANQSADASVARAAASQKLRDADDLVDAADDKLTDAIVAVVTPGEDQHDVKDLREAAAAKQKAADQRAEARAELTRELKRNPLPDPPREVCG